MGVIAEKDLIIFLKKVLGLSDKDSIEVRNSEKIFQSSDDDIIEESTIPNEYVDDDYVDDEEIFRHVPIEVKEIIRDEMANEKVQLDELSNSTRVYIENNISDKLCLINLDLYKIQIDRNKSVSFANEIANVRDFIISEYKRRVIAKFKEMYPDEYEQITNL